VRGSTRADGGEREAVELLRAVTEGSDCCRCAVAGGDRVVSLGRRVTVCKRPFLALALRVA
jgi:hypothetical protein